MDLHSNGLQCTVLLGIFYDYSMINPMTPIVAIWIQL